MLHVIMNYREIYQIYLNMFNDSLSEYTSVGLQSLQEFYAQQVRSIASTAAILLHDCMYKTNNVYSSP